MVVQVEKADWHLLVLCASSNRRQTARNILDRTPHVNLRLGEALL